jgi:pimeloyl-ACP methyl ester carboxylesterase
MRIRLKSALLTAAAAVLAVTPVYWANAVAGDTPPRAAAPRSGQPGTNREPFALDRDITDLPVSFTVRNINRTEAACPTDGRTYTVRGHLTAPTALLERGGAKAVTLYEHGIAAGEWYWRLPARGYHHTEELARRGHASLTIDRLGYDGSDKPDGYATCIGGQADIAHQIVQQLRRGTYHVRGTAPRFAKVFLAGQSNGGQIVQIEAYSFRDVDGLVIMDWTDRGLTPQANARFFTSLQTCLRGGTHGYAYYDLGTREFRSGNFHDTDPAVEDLAAPLQNRHPCGDMVSQLGAVLVDVQRLRTITVPVLFLYGEDDARVQGGAQQRALFTGAGDTRLVTVGGAGHYMGMARNAHVVHDTLAAWLRAHGG